jgi:hypothetical protein
MFNIDEYKLFILSKVQKEVEYNGKHVTSRLLEGLYQFSEAPSAYINEIPPESIAKKYKRMFNEPSKPISVSYNIWFLHCFGYKRCCECLSIKLLDSFYYSSNRWDFKNKTCSNCDKNNISAYRSANLEKIALRRKQYNSENQDKRNANRAKYRATKLQATPTWLNKQQLEKLLFFYSEAKRLERETGIKYHVDHIVPLQGSNVCGLHVPWNLQVIPAEDNIRKHNKWLN